MEKSITINSKEYKVPEINFGTICDLENYGINFTEIENKSFNFIRGLVAYTIGCDGKIASKEISEHINNGGSLEDFMPLITAVTESDFFQNLAKKRK